jgi:hypothetical protein
MITIFEKYSSNDLDGFFYPGGINGSIVGDYVVVINNNENEKIGKIIDVDKMSPVNIFRVDLLNEIDKQRQWKYWFGQSEIIFWSKTLEECELYMTTKKYNI